MITNIYGKTVNELDKMRVEEKIEHLGENIPDQLYSMFKEEWSDFVTRCVDKGQKEMRLEEFDYYFELFMKFPH
jgi:hypothetical protein